MTKKNILTGQETWRRAPVRFTTQSVVTTSQIVCPFGRRYNNVMS